MILHVTLNMGLSSTFYSVMFSDTGLGPKAEAGIGDSQCHRILESRRALGPSSSTGPERSRDLFKVGQ